MNAPREPVSQPHRSNASFELHFFTSESIRSLTSTDKSFLSRGDWRSFEPLIAAYVDAAMATDSDSVVATRVLLLSA